MNSSASVILLRLPLWRSRLLLAIIILWLLGLAGRAIYLQSMRNDFLQGQGDSRYSRVIQTSAHRGMIMDRFGEPLAVSTPVESVWAVPGEVKITPAQQSRLAKLLNIRDSELKERLLNIDREFVYLKRHLPPDEAEKIVEMGIPGLFLQREYRRYYPAGEVTSHLVGFTSVDDLGQEGLELSYQNILVGKPGNRHVIKDRLGRIVEDVGRVQAPQQGRDLNLSIDSRIQYLAFRELKQAVVANQAKAGAIVVMDVNSGEILAIANLPSYNPNNREKLDPKYARNRAITDLFEPGSTLKPFTIAAALEDGAFNPQTIIQTAPGTLTIGSATIHDAHPGGALTVTQVIQQSSNVGAAKIALELPKQLLWHVFNKVGFGSAPQSGFPGEASGKLRPYQTWRPIEQATMAYGHGISVSLLQLVQAYTIFATDGELKPISLVKLEGAASGQRVVSARTAREVRDMLELVTQPGGTAPQARVLGYRVAGKTGTAHKLQGGSYAADRYVSSFVGFAPASNPRVVVGVMIDEPTKGEYYGGIVAAPIFSKVVAGTLRILGIAPDIPLEQSLPQVAEEPLIREGV